MLAELTPELPTPLSQQVLSLLNTHYPGKTDEFKDTVYVCLEKLESHPFGDQLAKAVPTLIQFIDCTFQLLEDIVNKKNIVLKRDGVSVAKWVANNIIIPAIESEPYQSLESKLNLGENPFIPKPVEPPPVVINHHVIRNRLEMCMN